MRELVPAKSSSFILLLLLAALSFLPACGEIPQEEPEVFYSETNEAPKTQTFRWSNGKMPKSFDPAKASAPPETDIVRAIYEGLTDTDPKTLKAVPAVAKYWKSADENRVWVFTLREDAVWSNGEKVTAKDFVRSWQRVAELGEEIPHHALLHNITGVHSTKAKSIDKAAGNKDREGKDKGRMPVNSSFSSANTQQESVFKKPQQQIAKIKTPTIGVEAVSDYELKVSLNEPDEEFPKLVAHPLFKPVYAGGRDFEDDEMNASIITNGAFRIASVGRDGVTLDREERYFDKNKVKLKRVKFVPSESADKALAAYKAGEVDVVTNANFEPLALKLLTPFVDFKRTTHSALNFYQFNVTREPFNDKRVREALAIAIDRNKLTEGEMEGAAKPAFDYLPFDVGREKKLGSDSGKAKELFEKSGFPNAEGFPKIKLLVNRNNVQEKIAKSVAKMWKEALNVDTEILIKGGKEFDEIRSSGEYDIVRRGVVLPTADETANMLVIFSDDKPETVAGADKTQKAESETEKSPVAQESANEKKSAETSSNPSGDEEELIIDTGVEKETILTEAEAIDSIPAIPLYFPTSYSLVKPYVLGFEMNTLDAPSLKNVYIDSLWQPKKKPGQS
ncbi:MAG: peptide ABC transporter substrate-binding protein [Pyrinomonadaceae bacterium]|nr:peptide ABC transporter substrate-binding protein [Pyrinomonadaceae bacterium]